MSRQRSLQILLLLPLLVASYQVPIVSDRREVVLRLLGRASTMMTVVASSLSTQPCVAAVLSSKYCASGVGEGCEDLAAGNALIKKLQEKSAANREEYARVSSTGSDYSSPICFLVRLSYLAERFRYSLSFLLVILSLPGILKCLLHEELPGLFCCFGTKSSNEARWLLRHG
jgi:hypothetical protein